MEKSLLFAWIAVVCWAILPNLLQQELRDFHAATILILAYSVNLALALIRFGQAKYAGEAVQFPTGALLVIAVVTVVVWFVGDYAYASAFLGKGDLTSIMTVLALSPIAATAVKYMWVGGLPNRYHVFSYGAALVAIYFTAKGNVLASH